MTEKVKKTVSLVVEGGGMRGFYAGGVIDTFLNNDVDINYVIAVSAGAATATSYVSKQKGRNREIIEKYVCDKRYVSKRNIVKHGSFIGMDFIFGEIPTKLIPFDWETFENSKVKFLTGTFDCKKGQTLWYDKSRYGRDLMVLRASCSLPLVCKIVDFDGKKLLDGGINQPIPIKKAIEDGNDFHIIVLTQNENYRKKPSKLNPYKIPYMKYPKLIEKMQIRHKEYNDEVALCEKLEREGKAMIIRPLKKVEVGRLESDKQKILDLYEQGVNDTNKRLLEIKNILKN